MIRNQNLALEDYIEVSLMLQCNKFFCNQTFKLIWSQFLKLYFQHVYANNVQLCQHYALMLFVVIPSHVTTTGLLVSMNIIQSHNAVEALAPVIS